MSSLTDLETMVSMIGYRYTTLSFEVDSGNAIIHCEDSEGNRIAVEAPTVEAAIEAMHAKLALLINQGEK